MKMQQKRRDAYKKRQNSESMSRCWFQSGSLNGNLETKTFCKITSNNNNKKPLSFLIKNKLQCTENRLV